MDAVLLLCLASVSCCTFCRLQHPVLVMAAHGCAQLQAGKWLAAHAALLVMDAGQQGSLHALSVPTHLPSAGGGKTQCCSMLRDALCLLASQQGSTGRHQSVETLTLNPKSISLGELFGEYNAVTSEWRDGGASVLIRGAVSDQGPGHKWVVFDGPVDAVWVENMNTVRCSCNHLVAPMAVLQGRVVIV